MVPISALYVNGLYFGCTTLTTIGYGDFKPFGSDRLIFCVLFVAGILIYTMIFKLMKTHLARLIKDGPS